MGIQIILGCPPEYGILLQPGETDVHILHKLPEAHSSQIAPDAAKIRLPQFSPHAADNNRVRMKHGDQIAQGKAEIIRQVTQKGRCPRFSFPGQLRHILKENLL